MNIQTETEVQLSLGIHGGFVPGFLQIPKSMDAQVSIILSALCILGFCICEFQPTVDPQSLVESMDIEPMDREG